MAQQQSPGQKKTHHKVTSMSDEAPPSSNQLEGEGSYTATRAYDEHVAEHIKNEDIDALAEEARQALEGPEGKELREAEQQAKAGPKPKPRGLTARRDAAPPPSQK